MKDIIRRALTKKLTVKSPSGFLHQIDVEPSDKLVYGIIFAILALIMLTAIQIVHIIVLKELNSEISSVITLLIGTIMGVFFGKKT